MLLDSEPGKTKRLMLIFWERKRERIKERVTVNLRPGKGERPITVWLIFSSSRTSSPSSCAISPSRYSSLLMTED